MEDAAHNIAIVFITIYILYCVLSISTVSDPVVHLAPFPNPQDENGTTFFSVEKTKQLTKGNPLFSFPFI